MVLELPHELPFECTPREKWLLDYYFASSIFNTCQPRPLFHDWPSISWLTRLLRSIWKRMQSQTLCTSLHTYTLAGIVIEKGPCCKPLRGAIAWLSSEEQSTSRHWTSFVNVKHLLLDHRFYLRILSNTWTTVSNASDDFHSVPLRVIYSHPTTFVTSFG